MHLIIVDKIFLRNQYQMPREICERGQLVQIIVAYFDALCSDVLSPFSSSSFSSSYFSYSSSSHISSTCVEM